MKITNRWVIRSLATGIAAATRLLYATVKCDIRVAVPGLCPYDVGDQRYLYCLWHDGVMGVIFSGTCYRMAGLVSLHEDGSFLADAMECVGIKPIRGSSRRGGAAAVRQMFDAAQDYHIAIATDGPRGPRRVVKAGIIYLASQTGRLIVPVAFNGLNAWRPRGRWTDMIIPKPFSRSRLYGGMPIRVPSNISREQIEIYRQRVQAAMDELNGQAETDEGAVNLMDRCAA